MFPHSTKMEIEDDAEVLLEKSLTAENGKPDDSTNSADKDVAFYIREAAVDYVAAEESKRVLDGEEWLLVYPSDEPLENEGEGSEKEDGGDSEQGELV